MNSKSMCVSILQKISVRITFLLKKRVKDKNKVGQKGYLWNIIDWLLVVFFVRKYLVIIS
jgi:hypothetical protein